MKGPQYRCDYCNRPKGPSSRQWFLRWINDLEFRVIVWNDVKAQLEDFEHICSGTCIEMSAKRWVQRIDRLVSPTRLEPQDV